MCVYLFGGRSLPPCGNYELKRKYVDGKHQFGKAAGEIFRNNFYVEDMLKSLGDEKKAIKLMQSVRTMCASAGFRLEYSSV